MRSPFLFFIFLFSFTLFYFGGGVQSRDGVCAEHVGADGKLGILLAIVSFTWGNGEYIMVKSYRYHKPHVIRGFGDGLRRRGFDAVRHKRPDVLCTDRKIGQLFHPDGYDVFGVASNNKKKEKEGERGKEKRGRRNQLKYGHAFCFLVSSKSSMC